MKKFSLLHKIRNKIRIKGKTTLNISKNAKIVNCTFYIKGNNNTIIIKDNTILRKVNIEILGNNCKLLIDNHVMIGDNSYLSVKEGKTLMIGANCGLSRNIKILTSDGHPIFQDNKRINPAQDIIIKNNVWIGDNATILKGVTIGNNSVIGINSTLTKDIPNNCIAVGNPAKVVKENITWKP